MTQQSPSLPTFDDMMIPTIKSLQALGGSGSTDEIYKQVIEILQLSEDIIAVQHTDTGQTEVEYRLAWSRTYLKKAGILDNSQRGVWSLISKDVDVNSIKPGDIVRQVRGLRKTKGNDPVLPLVDVDNVPLAVSDIEIPEEAASWHKQLHKALLGLTPAAFERLAQRLLRESGFIEVEVTGRSNDGGIDGIGIARISGFLSFRVLFQCKRYQGSVTPSQIRDFRGAMQGRTDKGLFITTGTFTREAIREATRDGAPPIDLIDGDQLILRLKELKLGVLIKTVEVVEVDTDWFGRI